MRNLILMAMTVTLLGTACVFQSPTRTPVPTGTVTSTAAGGALTSTSAIDRTAIPTPTKPNTLGSDDDPHDSRSFAPPADQWKLFSSQEQGFEFRYPESCRVAGLNDSINVGGRIELAILGSGGLDLPDYVKRFVDGRAKNSNWQVEDTRMGSLGGRDAITVDYRFGGQGRFGTATFVLKDTRVFVWGLTAGAFTCDEPNVYKTVLSSFRFTR